MSKWFGEDAEMGNSGFQLKAPDFNLITSFFEEAGWSVVDWTTEDLLEMSVASDIHSDDKEWISKELAIRAQKVLQ